jgi:hypothetical protein
MTTTNHTPGPWALLDRAENSRTLTHITNGAHIVCTLGTTRTDGSPNHSANANLLASAPDLLSALQEAYNAIAWDIPGGNLSDADSEALLDTIRAAIAKAEGAK